MENIELLDVPKFTGKVSVIGDVMLDKYWYGTSTRISPEAPVPVVNVKEFEDRAGGAANVAINLSALGVDCELVGIVGQDEAAVKLDELLQLKNIKTRFISEKNIPTITKLRVLSRHQQLLRVDFEEGYENIDHGRVLLALRQALRDSKVLICSDYAKGALSSIASMIEYANTQNIPVLVDPKGSDFSKYQGATLLTPNMSEFEAVVGKVSNNEDLERKALDLIRTLNLKALLVTRSEDGMSLIEPNKKAVHIPTTAKEVFDVTGAGDTVISTLAAALASGCNLVKACNLANIAAGIVVGKLGTSSVNPQEILAKIKSQNHIANILDKDSLKLQIDALKLMGKKIVMTNGCFDLLHKGHVSYLQQARSLGDVLIVAVNSDASVKKLKGQSRPIVPLENRMAVLAALSCVDYVVSFDESTPQDLIAQILPDILVKGGDYTVEQIAGHQEVIDNGGEVKILHFVDNCSTSNIVNKIKAS